MDKFNLDELTDKLADAVPGDLQELREDLRQNFRGLLQNGLDKLDLVTREEFDVQRKVLEKTRAKLEKMEQELEELRQDTIRGTDADNTD